jgi:D-galactarolactone cycloisomerase
MKIANVTAFAVKIDREWADSIGMAGSPTLLEQPSFPTTAGTGFKPLSFDYEWAKSYRTLYSRRIETTIVKVETDAGIVGWGEAQSPVAPEITTTVINNLLGPLVTGEDCLAPEVLWTRMYSAMRVRGHTGSFMMDAIAGIDIALWDLCGKVAGQPIHRLMGGPFTVSLPCYISGLAGEQEKAKLDYAREQVQRGARAFKIFLDGSESECLSLVDQLRAAFGLEISIYVDALWRLQGKSAFRFSRQLGERAVGWLESPLSPEDFKGYGRLTKRSIIPIALGESYRSRFELLPFLNSGALDILQPDIGRTGLTEGRKIAALAETFHVPLAPHISTGLGPQIAAALHFGAASSSLLICECNPKVYSVANKFLVEPIDISPSHLNVPTGPGLGIEINEAALYDHI